MGQLIRRTRTRFAAATALAAIVAGCGGSEDPVQAALDELTEAAEERDAERFGRRVAAGFRGPGTMDRAEALATLRRLFVAYESVGLTVYGVETEAEEGGAHVRCHVEFSGQARKLLGLEGLVPPSGVYRFDLSLRDEAGVLMLSQAAWEVVH